MTYMRSWHEEWSTAATRKSRKKTINRDALIILPIKMSYTVAIMGATGAVGAELLALLSERNFPIKSLRLLASARSAGTTLEFKGEVINVEELTHHCFADVDIVLASAGGSISKEFVPSAVKSGAIVIDNTSFFRMHSEVPLVIPEVNPEALKSHKGIIANPNCSTIIMVLALFPLHKKFCVKRAVVATYQAASGGGAAAMQELHEETKAIANGETFERQIFPQQYGFNLFPHNAAMKDQGYNEEEVKMMTETSKIFGEQMKVSATCIRVPVMRAHSESINIEFEKPFTIEDAYTVLNEAPGVIIHENRAENRWATPVDASGKDPIMVGRLRRDNTVDNGLELWVVGDQIRKGAALNAVQIAEQMISYDLI